MVFGAVVRRLVLERLPIVLFCFFVTGLPGLHNGAHARLTPDLCWVYATLSMLETNYIHRHPGSKITLSRGAVQADSIADRMTRLIRGEPGGLEDGGLAVEALALIRRNGLVARGDFHHVVSPGPVLSSIKQTIARYPNPADKRKALNWQLQARLGVKPKKTNSTAERSAPGGWPKPCWADRIGSNSIVRATGSSGGDLRVIRTPARRRGFDMSSRIG